MMAAGHPLQGAVPPASAAAQEAAIEEVEIRVQAETRRRQARERRNKVIYPLAVGLLLLLGWELATLFLAVPAYLLPPPSAVVVSFVEHIDLLLREAWVTSTEILLGFGLSVVAGIPIAICIVRWPAFNTAVYPLLISAQAVPKVAVAPLFIVWFGFGLLPKVLIAFLIAFFPIVINTAMGLASIEKEKLYLARSIGLSSYDTFRLIRLPDALPSIFAGMKISITLAVVGAVVGEFVGGDAGLGYQLMIANGSMNTPLLFAGIVALTALGFFFFFVVEVVERLLLPHLDHVQGRGGTP